jgi:hypothetical protein
MGVIIKAALLTSLLLSSISAIPTITAKGAKLFTSDGKQFYNKGSPPLEMRKTSTLLMLSRGCIPGDTG